MTRQQAGVKRACQMPSEKETLEAAPAASFPPDEAEVEEVAPAAAEEI